MLTRGQGEPLVLLGLSVVEESLVEESGIVSGNRELCSVHGQPVLPAGGGGNSLKLGQRIVYSLLHVRSRT